MPQRVLSGIQPSGSLHLGNYFGAIRQFLRLQEEHTCYFFIASYHAMTTQKDPDRLQERILDIAASYLALGLDPARCVLFDQADVPEHHEFTWYLSCLAPMGLLERAHSYKDKTARGIAPQHALFAYPVLMAADILLYDADLVPVGKDQKQHVEITRDLAIRMNNRCGDLLTVPDPLILEDTAVVPGLDGEKMSKSYDNTIELFLEPKPMKKRIMSVVTDSTPVEDPKDPNRCTVFALYSLFASAEERAELEEAYCRGGMGYGEAKKILLARVEETFAPARERKKEILAHPDDITDILIDGAKRAREVALPVVEKTREAWGLTAKPRGARD
ncbi:MAG: tryptophan--tRNA ligase [Gemmatimonadota bacterium]|nr:tryptophan--tRNA ligase [Gemmatimonadota bacterium]MDP6803451.1 tryptophan--tRNA ligase [Gemmatimonadota bacterium]MDP7031456.1 tryptophan--tRNA ligase [Gemmatimonadota bacterium]